MRLLFIVILWLLTFGLSSCATVSSPPPVAVPQLEAPSWGNRVQTLSNLQEWDLNALIAIRANTTRQAGSANLKWKQSQQRYDILLFGPLGAGAMKLAGTPGQVSLETADGKQFSAATPEALLRQQSGWNLPVSSLLYWIRGLPVPKLPAQKSFDAEHRLRQLSQQGWTIEYLRYQSIGKIDLPDKILLGNAEVNVKIIIKNWQF
jgi:outer membrane lipoprotein LolB